MASKLEEEFEAVGVVLDMVTAARGGLESERMISELNTV